MILYHFKSPLSDWFVSSDELSEFDLKDFPADQMMSLSYWYSSSSYDGAGRAVGQLQTGDWVTFDLGHCSCYGPLEDDWPRGFRNPFSSRQAAIDSDRKRLAVFESQDGLLSTSNYDPKTKKITPCS